MKNTDIIFEWIENGRKHETEVSRESFYAMFDGLAKGFEKIGDNEISKKLVKIIPEADKIFINKDINETQDVPSIAYSTNGDVKLIKIMRRHEIVWAIFDKYCVE